MRAQLKENAEIFLNWLLPPRCVVSGQVVDQPGMVAPDIWTNLNFITAPMCVQCGVPFDYDATAILGEDARCSDCQAHEPAYRKARSAMVYDDVSRPLVLGFKHGDQMHMARSFVPWMVQAGREILADDALLIPVPLHPRKLWLRRYNQAAELARRVARLSGKEWAHDVLVRVRHTPVQGYLTRSRRTINVAGAFAVRRPDAVKGRNVVLVDDVLTTGATVSECARALLEAGAARVDVLTLARAVKETHGE